LTLIPRRLEDPLPQPPYVILSGTPIHGVPARGYVLRSVHHRCLICPSVREACRCWSSLATCSRQRPFGPGYQDRYPASYPRQPPGGGGLTSQFPAAFRRTGVRFLSILFPPRHRLALRSAYQAQCLDPDGVSTFRTSEIRPGWTPSIPRGRRCSHSRLIFPGRRLPHPSGLALFSGVAFRPSGDLTHEASSRVHLRSPVRSSPCLWRPDGSGALGLLP